MTKKTDKLAILCQSIDCGAEAQWAVKICVPDMVRRGRPASAVLNLPLCALHIGQVKPGDIMTEKLRGIFTQINRSATLNFASAWVQPVSLASPEYKNLAAVKQARALAAEALEKQDLAMVIDGERQS